MTFYSAQKGSYWLEEGPLNKCVVQIIHFQQKLSCLVDESQLRHKVVETAYFLLPFSHQKLEGSFVVLHRKLTSKRSLVS